MKRIIYMMLVMLLVSAFTMSCENKAKRLAKAKELLNRRCNKCHFSDKIYNKMYTKEDWENIVNRMISLSKESPQRKEIEISHEDAYEILQFLQSESGE